MNPWLVFTLFLLGVWLAIFLAIKNVRKEMFLISLFSAPFGLSEIFVVPAYWSPPSLFNLNSTTGFDIESIIFTFAVGGIACELIETLTRMMDAVRMKHKKIDTKGLGIKRYEIHWISILLPIVLGFPLYILRPFNPIYSLIIQFSAGAIATMLFAPHLTRKIVIGGLLFLAFYFLSFLLVFGVVYPDAVVSFWNLSALSGISVLGVPVEELLCAFSLGMVLNSIYERV